jgi:uncharacterized protein
LIFKKIEDSLSRSKWPDKYMVGDFEYSLNVLYKRELKDYYCAVGYRIFEVSSKGDIYPCQRFLGNKEWKMGNVKEKKLDKEIVKRYFDLNVQSSSECKNCWLRYICGGGCPHSNWITTGSINSPDSSSCSYQNVLYEFLIPLFGKYKELITKHFEDKAKSLKGE